MAETNNIADAFGQAATHAPQPMQAAASNAASDSSLPIGIELASTADPVRTLMKLIVRCKDDVVVGVHIAGPDAAEMIQLAAIAVKAGLTKAQWDATCAVHPTAAEELVTLKERGRDPADAPAVVVHVEPAKAS